MSETLTINSEIALAQAQKQLADIWRENRYVEVEIRRKAKQRTLTQSAALHLWCQFMAETLNEADRTEYSEVYEVLCRHLGQRFGVQCPEWPRRERKENAA